MADKKTPEGLAAERREYVSRVMNARTYGVVPGLLTSAEAVADALTRLRSGGVNLVGPECRIDFIPRHHAVSLRWAYFDRLYPEPTGPAGKMGNGIWYQQQGGGVSPAWTMLTQLASLAGVRWLICERVDDGSIPLFWSYRARAVVRYFDGTEREEVVETPYDLRDGSPECGQVRGKDAQSVADQLGRMRAKGAQRAETFAKSRTIRALLGLQQKYTNDAADMPFVFPTLVYVQPADPELDRLLALREMGLLERLGGRSQVLDASWESVQAARPALPDGGGDATPDFKAEAERMAQREREEVRRQAAPDPAAAAQSSAPGGRGGRSAPTREEDLPPWEQSAPKAAPGPACCVNGCNNPIPPDVLTWSRRVLGGDYCGPHGREELAHMRAQEGGA